jgi:hypothetical protein
MNFSVQEDPGLFGKIQLSTRRARSSKAGPWSFEWDAHFSFFSSSPSSVPSAIKLSAGLPASPHIPSAAVPSPGYGLSPPRPHPRPYSSRRCYPPDETPPTRNDRGENARSRGLVGFIPSFWAVSSSASSACPPGAGLPMSVRSIVSNPQTITQQPPLLWCNQAAFEVTDGKKAACLNPQFSVQSLLHCWVLP